MVRHGVPPSTLRAPFHLGDKASCILSSCGCSIACCHGRFSREKKPQGSTAIAFERDFAHMYAHMRAETSAQAGQAMLTLVNTVQFVAILQNPPRNKHEPARICTAYAHSPTFARQPMACGLARRVPPPRWGRGGPGFPANPGRGVPFWDQLSKFPQGKPIFTRRYALLVNSTPF